MKKKKVRQNIIPYESDKFKIGFEGNNTEGYAHVIGENVYADTYQIVSNLINDGYLVHATMTEFDEFNPKFIKGGMRAHEGYGFYFTDMQYKPLEYGNILWVVKKDDFNFLDSSTPISIDMFGEKYKIELHKLNDRLDNVRTNREYDYISSEIEKLEDEYNKLGGDDFFDYIDIAINKDNARTIAQLESRIRNSKYTVPKLTELYVSWGYDGYITDRIYTIFNFDKLKKLSKKIDLNNMNNLNESLNLSSFKVQDKLNPNFWKNEKLDSRVRLKLLDIADDFTDFLNVDWVKPEDITMTGSLANYNWSKEYSDIDLHIIIDYKKVDDRIEFVREYFKSKKELWNQEHENLKIFGYPVELYVQDKNEKHNSSGVYSLEKNEWIEKPQKKEPTKSNLRKAEQNAESWIEKIDKIMNRYYPDATDSEKENILNKLDSTFNDIKNSRRKSFSNGKDEMNKDNLTFKMLRRNGYLDKIHNKKVEIYDDLMSISENTLSNIIKENISKYILNEISIIDKYNKEKDKNNYISRGIDFDTFEELCNIDPTTKPNKVGKYCNWLIAKYNPNVNFNELKRCLEWFADGVKRNILTRYNIPSDINSFKSYEELIGTMNNLNNNDDLDISSSEYNNRSKLEGQFEVLGSNSYYDVIAPKTFEAEQYFGGNTSWCTVANDNYFSSYMKQGQLYIIYPKNGKSEYKMQFHFKSDSFADKDDRVYKRPLECMENVINDENIFNDLRDLCKEVFNKYGRYFMLDEEISEIAQEQLRNGVDPTEVFDFVYPFHEGYAVIELNNKSNFINTNRELLSSNLWFDDANDFKNGYARITLNGKENFINTNGDLLSPNQWFDRIYEFKNGYALIRVNGKCNFINTNGELFSPNQWFDDVGSFENGYAVIRVDNKFNLININRKLVSPNLWFDHVYNFSEGYAVIKLNKKYNFINTNGELLSSNLWFDDANDFHEGYAKINLRDKGWNYINTNGELLNPNQWFDSVYNFYEGYAVIILNKKYNFINTEGEFLSPNQWFDGVGGFKNGYAKVKLNYKYNYINTNGELLSPNLWFDDTNELYDMLRHAKANKPQIKESILFNIIDENILSNIIKENISKYIINEISIIDKYNKEKEKNNYINKGIDFDTFEELCNIDPTTKQNKVGKYCNWLIAKYNPNTNFNELKRCLEWFVDGVKRNILSRYNISPDINSFKTYEELINAMNNLNDNNDDLDISSSEYNNRNKLEGQFEVLGSNSSYDIIAPKTFDAERYFGSNTEWCTVANKNYFSDYMEQGQLYILYPKNGDSEYKMQFHFESVSFADKYDDVLGDPIDCIKSVIEDKNIYNELISLCKKVFAKNVKYMKHFLSFEEVLESILIELENGANPRNLFDNMSSFHEGFAGVRLKGKWNWINTEGKLLNPNKWFDYAFGFQEGYSVVEIKDKGWNYINTKGNFLRDDLWFDDAYSFKEGFAVVGLNGKWNWVNTEGEFFSPNQWFDSAGIFQNGVALVKLKNKWNFIKTDGNFLCNDMWFDMIWDFQDGFAKVEIESKGYNFINTEGKILCPDIWFDRALSFNDNVGIVELNSKGCNLINTEGELLSPNQWFDKIKKTENLYRVFLRDKGFNYINSNGEYVSDEWFVEAGLLRRGRAEVKLFNGEEFRLVIHPHNENKVILRKRMSENKKY